MSEEKKKPALFVPALNREGVADWSGGGSGGLFIGLNDFGRFRLAFKKLRFEQGQKDNLFYAADCKVLSAEAVEQPKQPETCEADPSKKRPAYTQMPDEKYQALIAQLEKNARDGKYRSCWTDPTKKFPVGATVTLTFPVGRAGTTADPKKADRDDRVLVEFLRVVNGLARGAVADFQAIIPKMIALPALADDSIAFDLDCIPSARPNVIVDPATNEVLRTSIAVWPNRYFRLVG